MRESPHIQHTKCTLSLLPFTQRTSPFLLNTFSSQATNSWPSLTHLHPSTRFTTSHNTQSLRFPHSHQPRTTPTTYTFSTNANLNFPNSSLSPSPTTLSHLSSQTFFHNTNERRPHHPEHSPHTSSFHSSPTCPPHNLAPLLARTSLAHPPQNLQHTNVKPTSPQTSTLKPSLKSPPPLFLLHICLRNTFLLPSLSFILIEITSSSLPKTFFKCDCFLLIEEITN